MEKQTLLSTFVPATSPATEAQNYYLLNPIGSALLLTFTAIPVEHESLHHHHFTPAFQYLHDHCLVWAPQV